VDNCPEPIMGYHLHHIQYQEDLPFWHALVEAYGAPTLELGCGTGRVMLPFLRDGIKCFGIDNDLEMLSCLRNLAALDNLSPNIIQADFTHLNLQTKFKVILLPCNTYSTLNHNQRQALLNGIHSNLATRGVFAISVLNPATLSGLPEYGYPQIEDSFPWPDSDLMIQVSSSWKRIGNLFILTWHYDLLAPDGHSKRYDLSTTHYIEPTNVIINEIESADYSIKELYGDFDKSEFSLHAPNLILVLNQQR
jgi:SAM-dependent methyltransferase